MQSTCLFTTLFVGHVVSQSLAIPRPSGTKTVLSQASIISGSRDFANQEFDRGHLCNLDVERPSPLAVFILEDGATLSNVIIGINAVQGVHCKGSCTLRNVWFRDVCEDAILPLGTGNVLIEGGGAQGGGNEVVSHKGLGTVTIKDYTVVGASKLYRSCPNCRNNGGARSVMLDNVKASGVTTLVGINSNYGEVSTISRSCGTGVTRVCQEYRGVSDGRGEAQRLSTTASCRGQSSLAAC